MEFPTYSVIDIETTGGHRYGNRIIEIAIVNVQNGKIIDQYETLIHPEMFVPVSTSYFTGITNEMVQNAPKFYQVAKKIIEMTTDTIFVAHNVYFDFNFIKSEFASLGYVFKRPRLCTVRLSRKLLPGYRSYSLGKLCGDLGIEIKNRHRAMGDAAATTELLQMLLEKNPDLHLATEEFQDKKILLPPNVSRDDYEDLPKRPGVYYFWDDQDRLLYVGKSKNIKNRITSHFRIDIKSAKEREMKGSIYKISFDLTGNDLCAQLLECKQIKTLRPLFNRVMRRAQFPYVVTWSENADGFLEPKITSGKSAEVLENAFCCNSKKSAQKKIARIYDQAFGIEPESLFFEEKLKQFKKTLKKVFNERILEIINKQSYPFSSFCLIQYGREINEKAIIMVENGKISRIEYRNQNEEVETIVLSENQDMKLILLKFISSTSAKIYSLEDFSVLKIGPVATRKKATFSEEKNHIDFDL